MADKVQEIVGGDSSGSVTIDGQPIDVTVDNASLSVEISNEPLSVITQQDADQLEREKQNNLNLRILLSIKEELKQINKTLKKIYQ